MDTKGTVFLYLKRLKKYFILSIFEIIFLIPLLLFSIMVINLYGKDFLLVPNKLIIFIFLFLFLFLTFSISSLIIYKKTTEKFLKIKEFEELYKKIKLSYYIPYFDLYVYFLLKNKLFELGGNL